MYIKTIFVVTVLDFLSKSVLSHPQPSASIETTTVQSLTQDHPPKIERFPIAEFDFAHVRTPFVISALILFACFCKIAFHVTPRLPKFLPESCMLIVIGLLMGFLLRFAFKLHSPLMTSTVFFLYILPPIIFDAGYFMPNRLFFDNLGTILLMAVIGTVFNIFAIGFTLWAFGLTGLYGSDADTPNLPSTLLFTSVVAATDPVAVLAVFEELHVNELLYIIVFGESLLNDAVTVVIYHVIEVYHNMGVENVVPLDIINGFVSFFVIALGGALIGVIWGFLSGLVTRFTYIVHIVEPLFVFVMAYLSYLNAEIFHMSSILAITFCGLTMKSYVEANVTKNSCIAIRHALKAISNSAETVVFVLLGIATVQMEHVWNTWFVVLTIFCCSVFRIFSVIGLVAISNRFRLYKLSRSDQTIMSFGGLRGAVSFALVLLMDENSVEERNMFVTTTLILIYFTVFLQGITVKPILKWLRIRVTEEQHPTLNECVAEKFLDHLLAGVENISGNNGTYNLRLKVRSINRRFIEPLLLRDVEQSERKLTETYSESKMRDALELLSFEKRKATGPNALRLVRLLEKELFRKTVFGQTNFAFDGEEMDSKTSLKNPPKSTCRKRLSSV